MSNRTIEAALKLSTKLGDMGAFRVISRELKKVDQQSRSMSRSQVAMAKSTGAAYAAVGRVVAPAMLAYGAKQAVTDFAQSERRINRIAVTAGKGAGVLTDMRASIDRISYDYAMSQDQVTSGLDALIAAGREAEDAMSFLPAVTATAQASGSDIVDIATTADAIGNSFHIAGDKMQGAFDIMVEGGKAGKFELKDMAQYLPSMAPAFEALGYKGEQGLGKLVALLQTIRMRTGSAGEAATAAQNIFQKMESEETVKKFSKFGVDLRAELTKARKEGKDLVDVFMDLTDKATKGDYSKLTQLFTDAQFQVGMRALMQGRKDMEGFTTALKGAHGSTLKDLNQILSDSQAKIDRLGSSWDKFKNSIGSGLTDAGVTDLLADAANEIDYASAVNRGLEQSGVSGFWERSKWGVMNDQAAKDTMAWKGGYRTDEQRQLIKTYADQSKLRPEQLQRDATFGFGRDANGAPIPIMASAKGDFDAEWIRQKVDGAIEAIADAARAKHASAPIERADAARQAEIRMLSDGGATYEQRLASGYYRNQGMGGEAVAGPVNSIAQAIAQLESQGRNAGDAVKSGGDAAGQAIAQAAQSLPEAGAQLGANAKAAFDPASLGAAIGQAAAAEIRAAASNITVTARVNTPTVNVNAGRSMVNAGRVGGPD